MKKKKRLRVSDIIMYVIMLAAMGVFLYSAYQLYQIFSEYRAGEQEYDVLREYVQVMETPDIDREEVVSDEGSVIDANELPQCPVTVDFDALKAINEDIVGWVYVEAVSGISYPLVQGEDNSYYLTHTVEKVQNSSASIFLDYRNASDFTDSNTVIYGHNMKNQSMFGKLSLMKEEETFAKSPYIWVVTPEGEICYEAFSARNVSEADELYSIFQCEPEQWKNMLDGFQSASEIKSNMVFDGTEQIITLSTCTSNDTVRCVVHAVRKEF